MPKVDFGRHFDHTNQMVSRLTRQSLDLLKLHYRDDMTDEVPCNVCVCAFACVADCSCVRVLQLWRLCAELKGPLGIP